MAAGDTTPDGDPYRRPDGVDDATIRALGRLTEALETAERARGHLFGFHQLIGSADVKLGDAADLFDLAGHHDFAERLRTELVGRNVIEGRWTFQVVDEFDAGYYAELRGLERDGRDRFAQGGPHLYEAQMKERRRTRGRAGHESRPQRRGRPSGS